jgi:Arc/MetJ-type ribon-helix-helix transcriptional regulator
MATSGQRILQANQVKGRESARLVPGFSNMSNTARPIQLPQDLQAFAEERVRAGESASVDDVVRGALQEKKLAVLQRALDEGIAELDAGLGVETTPDDLMAEISAELGLDS